MECKCETPRLEVEVDGTIYEIEFGQVQVEITGRCNMCCQHCRGSYLARQDMEIAQVIKIIRFARQFSPNYKEVVLSGGEPLLHGQWPELLLQVRQSGGEFVTMTTNGSLLARNHLNLIGELAFSRFILSVSLDSLDSKEHDEFRRHASAHEKAVRAMKMVADSGTPNVIASMRSTLRPSQIKDMEAMVAFAQQIGCKRVSFSAIHPAGAAANRPDLWMTVEQKKQFIYEIYRLKKVFPEMTIKTNDPLKVLVRGFSDVGKGSERVFDGCGAGAITFNVNSDGTMTPCSLMNLPMMNVFPMSIEEITEAYRNNGIGKNMLTMNLRGKCGSCDKKYQCGGCRVRAIIGKGIMLGMDPIQIIQQGIYLEEDPHCWL